MCIIKPFLIRALDNPDVTINYSIFIRIIYLITALNLFITILFGW